MIDNIAKNFTFNSNDEILSKISNCRLAVKIHKLIYLKNLTENTQCFCAVEICGKEFKTRSKSIENLNFDEVSKRFV
jgi:hypothetical protein